MRFLVALVLATAVQPSPAQLCTAQDPDFAGFRYGGVVAICNRHVTSLQKRQVFARAGVPWIWRARYEVDHIVPLCAGGSNALANLQLQKRADADAKDVLEKRACSLLRRGRIDQQQAIQMVVGP